MKTLNISDIFTKEGIQKLKRGQLLRFSNEGSITELKLTYVNKKINRVWAKETKTFTPEEIEKIEKERSEV